MKEAKELQEKAIAEHEAEAEKAVDTCMAEYVSANKEGGKGMTKEELEANISKSMPDSPNLAKALSKFVTASREMAEVDSLLGSLNDLIIDTNVIEQDIKTKEAAKDQAVKAAEAAKAAQASSSRSCDPIGFMKDGARYDFIVDDGSFDSTSDFLGADNQWASMEALDKDGDKIINASELKEAGIKMVKTVNGEKKVVDVAEEFGEDFQVDLNSYKQGGSFDGIDSTKDTDGDGTVDQQLLGTYTIKIGNEDIKGYNTLDDVDYLSSEYNIKAGKQATAKTGEAGEYSAELQEYNNFFKTKTEEAAKLGEDLDKGLAELGITEATIKNIKDHAKTEGAKDADAFMTKAKAEAEEEQKAEDAKKAEEKAAKEAEEKKEAQKADEAKGTEGAKGNEDAKYQEALNKYKEALASNDENTVATALANLKEASDKAGKSQEEAKADLQKLGVNVNWQ